MNPKQRLKSWQNNGIEIESYQQYEELYIRAKGKCEACGRKLAKENGNTEIPTANLDHDHRNGMPRGILCSSCNRAIHEVERFRYAYLKGIGDYLLHRCLKVAQINSKLTPNKIQSKGGKK